MEEQNNDFSTDTHLALMKRLDALRAHHAYIKQDVMVVEGGAKTMSNQVLRGGRLWIDNMNAAEHDLLKARGITAVVALGSDHTHYAEPLDGVVYFRITIEDYHYEKIALHFERATSFIHAELSKPNGRVLVHCAAGVSRSATICIAYLMRHHHLSLAAAYAVVLEARCVIDPNPGFMEQLKAYENELAFT
jgi:protein-tyrosine phosphatase